MCCQMCRFILVPNIISPLISPFLIVQHQQLRIKNEKIYVEYDGTDEGFADVFAAAGVPKEDIVLAFHAPAKRPYTGFAVA